LDLSSLESLGKIAGVGGIAIGAVVLLVRPIINRTTSVPAAQREATLRLLAIGAFGIGALGIIAWLASGWSGGQHATTRANESPAIVSGGDATVTSGPPSSVVPTAPKPQGGVAPNAGASTAGERSPAIIAGGNATVSTPSTPPAPK
jgi:hypothetical protein